MDADTEFSGAVTGWALPLMMCPAIVQKTGRQPSLRGHQCVHTGAGYVIANSNNNKFVMYLSVIYNTWSEGPNSKTNSPPENNVNNTINLKIKIIKVWLVITF